MPVSWNAPIGMLAALLLGVGPGQASAASGLDRLMSGFERCAPPPGLVRLGGILRDRHSFETKANRRRGTVDLPRIDGTSFGQAQATDEDDHTKVHLALTGTFRDLPVTAIEFRLGHGNGINVTTLVFAAPDGDVYAKVGPVVREAMDELRRDDEARNFGLSAKIVTSRGRTFLVSDRST